MRMRNKVAKERGETRMKDKIEHIKIERKDEKVERDERREAMAITSSYERSNKPTNTN
jgi:hypothetical protein